VGDVLPRKETAGCVAVWVGSGLVLGFLSMGAIGWVQEGLLMVERISLVRVALSGMTLTRLSVTMRFA